MRAMRCAVAETCGSCHADEDLVARRVELAGVIPDVQFGNPQRHQFRDGLGFGFEGQVCSRGQGQRGMVKRLTRGCRQLPN